MGARAEPVLAPRLGHGRASPPAHCRVSSREVGVPTLPRGGLVCAAEGPEHPSVAAPTLPPPVRHCCRHGVCDSGAGGL